MLRSATASFCSSPGPWPSISGPSRAYTHKIIVGECLLYPQLRTCARLSEMSALCQKRTLSILVGNFLSRLIMSATHAGDIPVTPDNSNNLISLGGVELITTKQILAALLLFEKPYPLSGLRSRSGALDRRSLKKA